MDEHDARRRTLYPLSGDAGPRWPSRSAGTPGARGIRPRAGTPTRRWRCCTAGGPGSGLGSPRPWSRRALDALGLTTTALLRYTPETRAALHEAMRGVLEPTLLDRDGMSGGGPTADVLRLAF